MLLSFVIAYWLISIAIGLYAALRVHNTKDFAIAGRALPMYVVTATVFATWFGSEAVLGIPAEFLKNGLHGVVADPFGSSLCLIFVGLFFAKPLYRMNLLTIGDYYRQRFGRTVEIITTLCIIVSYLGWVAAQIKALGLVFNVLSDGAISQETGMWLGSASVLIYTLFGGMWSVAITDFIQMIVIVIGLLYIGWEVSDQAGGVATVVSHAHANGKFNFFPEWSVAAVIPFVATWMTMMLGSMPQQDVFQRVQSSASEKIAVRASVLGGSLYFCFTFIPMFLAYSATLITPDIVEKYLAPDSDSQLILPMLVLEKAPMFAQILFFGALLSAIKSCASATLLAPSVTFSENLIRPILQATKVNITDKQFLRVMQVVVFTFTVAVTAYAASSELTIYGLVENAYKVTFVAAFIPLACGVYWKRATTQGAIVSMVLGLMTWISLEVIDPEAIWPPQFVGFLVSAASMVIFSYLPQFIGTPGGLLGHSGPSGYHAAAGHGVVAAQERVARAPRRRRAVRPKRS